MTRPIDHLVLAVPDLAAARAFYDRLGFTVGAPNRHPWGTENAIIQLDGVFLELIGLGEGDAPLNAAEAAAPFAEPVAAAVARGGGLALVALGSTDADADAAAFLAAGVGRGRRLDFGRTAVAADGTRRPVSFDLAIADTGLPEAGLFTCRHRHPENFWNPAAQRHRNGALRLQSVTLATEPSTVRPAFGAILGTPAPSPGDATGFATPTGRIDITGPEAASARYGTPAVPGRFAGFGVVVETLSEVAEILAAAAVPFRAIDTNLVVPPEAAFGVALAFVPVACHSLA